MDSTHLWQWYKNRLHGKPDIIKILYISFSIQIIYESIPFTQSNYIGDIGSPPSPITVNQDSTSLTINNLTPNSQYHFTIYAHNQAIGLDFSSSNITGTGITNEDGMYYII